jgi:hypothetical protein
VFDVKKLLIINLLCLNFTTFAQTYSLGGSLDFSLENEISDLRAGPNLMFLYSFEDLPISLRFDSHYYLNEIGYEYSNFNFGSEVLFSPISCVIEPYVGVGLRYNINEISSEGLDPNPPKNIRNNFSGEFISGINFSANSPINFIMEIYYTTHNPKFNYEYDSKIVRKRLKLNVVFLRAGIMFRL